MNNIFKMSMPIIVSRIIDGNHMDVRVGHQFRYRCVMTHKQFRHIAEKFHNVQYEPRYRSKIDGRIIGNLREQIMDKIHAYLKYGEKL